MNKKYKIILILICIFLIGIYFYPKKIKSPTSDCFVDIKLGEAEVYSKVSKTEKERKQGLSGTKQLKEGEGMLFIFPEEDKHSFWMKDMNYSIDVIWFDKENKVSFVEKDFNPESFPKVVTPLIPGKYVLEVPSGFFKSNNLKIGDKLEISTRECL
jgi:uncharacterized protein